MSNIKETPNYKTVIGHDPKGNACYCVVNKLYDVIEIQTFLLPQAIKQMYELQSALDAITSDGFFSA
jgi:hypothetical protein